MSFTKITQNDTNGKGVVGLPDAPGLAAGDMQKKFDELATDVIIPKFNQLSTELDNMQIGTELTYNQWNALTEAQKANGDYYITDYPDEFAKAVNIPIDSLGWVGNTNVQNMISEIMTRIVGGTYSEADVLSAQNKGLIIQNTNIQIDSSTKLYGICITCCPYEDNEHKYSTQLFISWDGRTYIRAQMSGTWSSWKKLVTEDDFLTKTLSITTDGNGNAQIGVDSNYSVLSVYCSTATDLAIFLPYIYNGLWQVHAVYNDAPVKNWTGTIIVKYIKN